MTHAFPQDCEGQKPVSKRPLSGSDDDTRNFEKVAGSGHNEKQTRLGRCRQQTRHIIELAGNPKADGRSGNGDKAGKLWIPDRQLFSANG